MSARDVLITGIGLVSSLGVGREAHWQALSAPGAGPVLDRESFAPYTIHPLPGIEWGEQIPKRGDQRQMETWQRLGVYAAGLALDDAEAKDEALCGTMDMVVAAGGGERDVAVDQTNLEAGGGSNHRGGLRKQKLTTELRPTLFLAQLSNLLAGNISIVHKVTGSSRTFMGEEGAGISAVETAVARIRNGQSSHLLVGGAFQTEHVDMLLGYELAGYLHRDEWKPVWERQGAQGGGVVTGSGAAFLLLESREHAQARGRKAYAALGDVVSGRDRRNEGLAAELAALLDKARGNTAPDLVVSGASGAHAATAAEEEALASLGAPCRAFSSLTGHLKEAQFPFAIALAALAIARGAPFPPFASEKEQPLESAPGAVLATAIGHHRFEGAALVVAA